MEVNEVIAVKNFDIFVDLPFDVSDKPFEIRYNENMNCDMIIDKCVGLGHGRGPYSTMRHFIKKRNNKKFFFKTLTGERGAL